MLALAIATVAQAEAHYQFWIGSTEVTSDNFQNIQDESIKSGTAKYDANNNKLILTNVTIQPNSGTRAIRNQNCTDLTIEFRGTCKLKTINADAIRAESGGEVHGNLKLVATSGSVVTIETEGTHAISTQTSIDISGPGTDNITSNYNDQTILCKGWLPSAGSIYIGYDTGSLNFKDDCNVTITNTGNGNCIKGDNFSSLYFGKGTVVFDNSANKPCIENINDGDDGETSIRFWSHTTVLDPLGAEPDDKSIVLNGEKVKGHMLISNDYVAIINENYFPSSAFRVALRELFPKGYINSTDVEGLTTLDLSSRNLGNVTGINYLSNLRTLILTNNNLPSLSIDLPLLETLYCDQNRIQWMELQFLPALKKLDCHDNALTWMDVSTNSALTYVNAAENSSMTEFTSGENNTALERLFLTNNSSLTTLGVSSLTGLKQLGCAFCTNLTTLTAILLPNLTSIDAAGCSSLTQLWCSGSGVTSLNVANCTALTNIHANSCKFTTLTITGLPNLTDLDVSNNTLLKTLNCSGNALTNLNLDYLTALESLDCSNNAFVSLGLTACTALQSANLSFNNFQTVYVTGLSNLSTLLLTDCPNLQYLTCYNNALNMLNVARCPLLESINCRNNCFTDLYFTDLSKLFNLNVSNNPYLKTLNCSNSAVRGLNIEHCDALESINLSNNPGPAELELIHFQNLRSLNLLSATNLTRLAINDAPQLTSLNISGCTGMQILSVKYTGLPQLTANNLSELYDFYCEQNNAMTQLECNNNPKLYYMEAIYNSSLATLNCTDNTALTELRCYINALSTLDVTGCTALQTLTATQNAFVNLTIQNMQALATLYIGNNLQMRQVVIRNNPALTSFNISDCPQLYSLTINNNNQLASLNVSNATSLTNLNCPTNAMLSSLNVEGCTALTNVACNGCAFTELNLSNLPALKRIEAHNNQLTSLNAAGSTALQYLLVHNNPDLIRSNITFETGELLGLNISKTKGLSYDYIWGMPKLQTLIMDETSLSYNINIQNNPCLTTLSIKNCPTLANLYCDNNALVNLDASGNTQMQNFSCSANSLTSLRLQNCPALRFVGCYKNQLDGNAMTTLIGDLPTIPSSENAGNLRVLATTDEGNVFTNAHEAAATAKRWNALMNDGSPINPLHLLGDINHDNKVDVGDVNIVINIMLGKTQASAYPGNPDVNHSGSIDVSDVNKIINILLGKEPGGNENDPEPVEVTYDYTTASSLQALGFSNEIPSPGEQSLAFFEAKELSDQYATMAYNNFILYPDGNNCVLWLLERDALYTSYGIHGCGQVDWTAKGSIKIKKIVIRSYDSTFAHYVRITSNDTGATLTVEDDVTTCTFSAGGVNSATISAGTSYDAAIKTITVTYQ